MRIILLISCKILFSANSIAHPPWGLVVDNTGTVYFADIFHHERGAVWSVSAAGELTLLFSDFHAHNVSLDANGRLITASGEGDLHYMTRMNPGSVDTLVFKSDYRQFNGGSTTYSPERGILFGAEGYIWRLNASGQREKVSEYKFAWNQLMFCDEAGTIYAPDIGRGHGQLVQIDRKGNATVLASDLIAHLDRPVDPHNDILMGIAKDPEGMVYIAELAGQRVLRIDPAGNKSVFYSSQGDWFPTAITFHEGRTYLLEFKTKGKNEGPQVVVMDANGNKRILFNYDQYLKQGKTVNKFKQGQGHSSLLVVSLVLLLFLLWSAKSRGYI